ncbi:MAG: M48 family metallopeptidase [Candidatus Doudnabacteria bacterium]|nr:M48 family metallopeptidase [Candidatus Doudnabacteria bacterium]
MSSIRYEIKQSTKARHIRITLYPDGRVVVTKPVRAPRSAAQDFVDRKSAWIQKKLEYYKNREVQPLGPVRSKTLAEALAFVKSRIEYYNQHYGLTHGKVSIKNHKSLWGSCSARKNLNFNHKIVELPLVQADYIIVHELCHLKEFNHSKKFWALVAETIPNYREIKNELRNYSFR